MKKTNFLILLLTMLFGLGQASWAQEANVAKVGNTEYATLDDAVAAATEGQTILIIKAGDYKLPNLPNNVTIQGAAKVKVSFAHTLKGSIASVPNGATFNNVTFNWGNVDYHGFQHAGTINMENCTLNGKLFSYGDMNFTDCKFVQDNSDYHMWAYSGNVTYKGCSFTNNKTGKFINVYNEGVSTKYTVTVENCTFINNAASNKAAINVKATCGSKLLNYDVIIKSCTTNDSFPAASITQTLAVINNLVQVDDRTTDGEDNITVTLDNKQVYPIKDYVAQVGDKKYESLKDALDAAKESEDIVVDLLADAALDITAWDGDKNKLSIGSANTKSITINGNSHKLTFNQLNSDWNNVATMNDAVTKLVLNDMAISNSGYNNGPWNRHDINFNCAVELNNVTSDKALAFKNSATLKNVKVTDTGDVYGIWIKAVGQNISIDGLTIDAGRGIKIDSQYTDTPALVTMDIANATFNTAKKSAILVKTPGGAVIKAGEGINIDNVEADKENLVWVDEDKADEFYNVTVEGATIVPESKESDYAACLMKGEQRWGFYKKLSSAIDKVEEGYSVKLCKTTDEPVEVSKPLVIVKNGFAADKVSAGEGFKRFDTDNEIVIREFNPVAAIGEVKYESLEDAFAASADGDTITLLADCSGNGIKAAQGRYNEKGLTVDFAGHTYTVDGATVGSTGTETNGFQLLKDNKITFSNGTISSEKAKILVQNYSDLTLEGMTLTLDNKDYKYAYTLSNNNGNIVIDGTTINANHAGGFAFDVCRYASYPSVSVTVKGESVINGDVEVSASGSDAKDGFSLMLAGGTMSGEIVLDASAKAAMSSSPDKAKVSKSDSFDKAAPADYKWVSNDDGTSTLKPCEYVASIGDNKYESLKDALDAAKESEDIVVDLLADAALDITAWDGDKNKLSIGSANTKSITINGNSHKLTFNQLNSDWNNVATMNDAVTKLVLNDMAISNSGYNNGPWNRHDINFNCAVELNNVTSDKALAFKNSATLKNVKVTDTGDVYGIWIKAVGQNISIDGLTIDAGRGIKIDSQYTDTPALVTMDIANATFNTAKKSAILVKTPGGAVIKAGEGINIDNVEADKENLVWVDEDKADEFYNVTVEGATIVPESKESDYAACLMKGEQRWGFYKKLSSAIDKVEEGYSVKLCKTTDEPVEVSKPLVIVKNGFAADKVSAGEGFKRFDTDNEIVIREFNPVAAIGEVKYESLQEAVDAAADGDTITLLADVKESVEVKEGRKFVLDLNGKILEGYLDQYDSEILVKNGTISGTVWVNGGAEETDSYNKFTLDATATIISDYGIVLYQADKTSVAYGSAIDINGTVTGNVWVMGNIHEGNSVINVNSGSSINGTVGIALNGNATLNIKEGSVIEGSEVGVEVRAGKLNVEGGKISSTAETYSFKPNNSGTTTLGAAIAVAQHNTKLAADVLISGGEFMGVKTISVVDAQSNGLEGVSVTVADSLLTESVEIPADYKWVSNSDGTSTLKPCEYVASIGDKKYESLQEAVDAAGTTAATVKLLTEAATDNIIKGNGVKVRAGQNITFDLNGLTYNVDKTVGSNGTETNGFQLLKGSTVKFTNGTVTSNTAQILIQNYSNLTLEGVTVNAGSAGYAVSNNFGSMNVTGGTYINAKEGGVAFDLWYGMSSVYDEGIKVNFDENFTGKVTGKIEYGHDDRVADENWQEKASLVIKAGDFDIDYAEGSTDALNGANIEIYGGSFLHAVPVEYCAEGYVPTELSDGRYSVVIAEDADIVLKDPTIEKNETYSYTKDTEVNSITYLRKFDEEKHVNKYQPWYVPVDYTIKAEDLEKFDFFKIHMIAASAEQEGVVENIKNIFIHIAKLKEGDVLKANKPYVITPKQEGEFEFECETTLKAMATGSRMHTETTEVEYDFYGTYSTLEAKKAHEFIALGSGTMGWNKNAGNELGSYRWYLVPTVKDGDDDAYSKSGFYMIEDSEEVDGIDQNVRVEYQNVEGIYTLSGIKIDKLSKGVNIVRYTDGTTKKIFIK